MKKLFFALLLISPFSIQQAWSQTGPGGVGNSTTNPLWLDAHTMGGSNGSPISSFTDFSGNGANAVQGTTNFQPTLASGSLNGRDALDFNGTQSVVCPANAALDNLAMLNFYCIAQLDNLNILSIPLNFDYGGYPDHTLSGFLTQSGAIDAYGRYISSLKRANYVPTTSLSCFQGLYRPSINSIQAIKNNTFEDGEISNRLIGTNESVWVGGFNADYEIDGKIGEIFVFDFVLNATQDAIVQNYLAAKYGIALTVADMYSFEGSYGLGVIGIGKDASAASHTDSQGNGYVRISNPDDLQDGEYLFIGHDDVELTSFNLNTNVPASLPGSSRFVRQWRAEKTGNLGNITLVFDLDPATNFSPDPANYRLLIHSASDMSGTIDHVIAGTYNAGDETITFTNVDLNTGDFFTLAGDTPADIHSIATGNWSQTSTWDCTCIPSSFNNVFIDPGHNVTVDVDAFANSFSIDDPTATLTMDQNFTLSINSDFDNSGTLNASDGTILMSGSTDQHIDAGGNTMTFHNLTIDNSGSGNIDLLQADYHLIGELIMDQGNLTVDNTGNGILVIDSDANTTTGSIGPIAAGSSITGNVRVERFLPAGNADWRNLASPAVGATLSDWDNDLSISGFGFPDGCAYSTDCFYSVKYFVDGNSVDVTSINHPLAVGEGFEVFVGDDLVSFSGATISSTGTVTNGNGVVQFTSHEWETKGNPFPCPVDWDLAARSDVANYFYIYDAANGQYQFYDGSDGSFSTAELAGGVIASGQGFWAFGGLTEAGTVTFEQQDKVTTANFIRSNENPFGDGIQLALQNANMNQSCKIALTENMDVTDGFDDMIDIPHLASPSLTSPEFYFTTGDLKLRKNQVKMDFEDKSFQLGMKIKVADYYTIEGLNIENFVNYSRVILVDKSTGEKIDLKDELTYTFHSDTGVFDRFTLILSNAGEVGESEVTGVIEENEMFTITQMGHFIEISCEGNCDENATISIFNLLGQNTVYFNELNFVSGSHLINLPEELKGVHIMNITCNGKKYTKKLVF